MKQGAFYPCPASLVVLSEEYGKNLMICSVVGSPFMTYARPPIQASWTASVIEMMQLVI